MKQYLVNLNDGRCAIVEGERVEIQKDNMLVFYDSEQSVSAAFNPSEYLSFLKLRNIYKGHVYERQYAMR